MSGNKFDLDSDLVHKLARLLKETGLSEIEFSEGDKRIRCARSMHTSPASYASDGTVTATLQTVGGEIKGGPSKIKGHPVTSPMVGTVYLSSEPGKPTFVKVGDTVKEGDTLLIIEAMKVMNPIKAPQGGTIAEVLVGDSKPVEFGEVLIVIS